MSAELIELDDHEHLWRYGRRAPDKPRLAIPQHHFLACALAFSAIFSAHAEEGEPDRLMKLLPITYGSQFKEDFADWQMIGEALGLRAKYSDCLAKACERFDIARPAINIDHVANIMRERDLEFFDMRRSAELHPLVVNLWTWLMDQTYNTQFFLCRPKTSEIGRLWSDKEIFQCQQCCLTVHHRKGSSWCTLLQLVWHAGYSSFIKLVSNTSNKSVCSRYRCLPRRTTVSHQTM